ncbi:MAG: chemotaxis protein CheX [Phycisphaeraceae bacterium]|nr:chemotaxis protein CheX [Phycisphaeraceae bacterium]
MDTSYIVAFVSSVQDVASTALDMTIQVGQPRMHEGNSGGNDVSAIIGLSGDCVGSIALCLSTTTAAAMVGRFVGMEIDPDGPDFADGVGELANMISGGAKARFAAERNVSISCPSVVMGPNHRVIQQKDLPVVELPIQSECGEILIVLAIQEVETATNRAAG